MSLLLALTGGGGPTNYTVTANAGSYSVSGVAAGVTKSKLVTGTPGAYVYTGVAAGINYAPAAGYTITAVAGAYSVSGQQAAVSVSTLAPKKIGGDDVPIRYEVWEKRVKRKNEDETLDRVLREAYDRATGKVQPVEDEDEEGLMMALLL